MSLGIYVHIPFCKSKCRYCDFNSSDNRWGLEDIYTDAVVKEIKERGKGKEADTVFIGGGTPTAIKTDNLLRIIDSVYGNFNLQNPEFTVECNPATMGYDGFLKLKKAGVNRLSIGLQSANDGELSILGRIHTFETFLSTYSQAREAGFDNINIDLMFSLPDQTFESFSNTLCKVADLKPEHISCYSLIIEEGTPFYSMDLNLPDEETDRKMYEYAIDFLAQRGYNQYEISNFALENKECRHNLKYWQRQNYLGFGCGAAGLFGNIRSENTYNIREYIVNNTPRIEELTKEEEMAEHIFLGLRMMAGFSVEEFNHIYNVDFKTKYSEQIEKFTKAGLMVVSENCRLTREGVSVSNSVMCEFV